MPNSPPSVSRSRMSLGRTALVLAVIGPVVPMLACARCEIESLELPVTMQGSRAVATIGINGTPVPMTVDSGAFYSMLTDAAASQLKLTAKRNPSLRVQGILGSVEARTATVEKVSLLKGDIGSAEFVVGGNEPGAGTMGLLGRNILSFADTEYDLAHGTIRFLFPNDDCAKANMAYWAGPAPVTEIDVVNDYRSRVPAIRADIKLNGHEFIALFDTGATTLVSARAARRAGVPEAEWKPYGGIQGAGRGSAQAWTVGFDKFEIGGEAILHNRLMVADIALDDAEVLLGIDFFLSHRIYVSKKQSKLFITYNGGPVFALDKSAVASAPSLAADPSAGGADVTTADQYARRGAASAARHDLDGALSDFDRACEMEPTSAAFFSQRGAIQLALKRPGKALEDFEKALELDPAQVDARLNRAAQRLAAKDRDGAKDDVDVLDRTLAPQAPMRLTLAGFYLNLGQPALALAQLNQWLDAHPNEVNRTAAKERRCWARVMLGVDLDRAIDDCDDAVDSDAKNAGYRSSRGWAYLRSGRYGKAVADFDDSLASRAGNALALYGRGIAKTRLGNAVEGEVDLAAAKKAQANIEARVKQMGLMTAGS